MTQDVYMELRKDGNFMLTAPLELNPAPANGNYVRPSLIFSFRGSPKWTFATTSDHHLQISTYVTSGQLIFSNAHFNFGSSVPTRSFAQYGPILPVFGKVSSGFVLMATDAIEAGSTLPLQSRSSLGAFLPAIGRAWLGMPVAVPDPLKSGPLLLVQSLGQSGSAAFALGCCNLASAPTLRSVSCSGFMVLLFGVTCLGTSLPVLDFILLDVAPPVRGFVRMGSVTSICNWATVDVSLTLQSSFCPGTTIPVVGASWPDSFLSAPDRAETGSALPLRSLGCFGSSPFVSSFLHVGMPLFLRQYACLGSAFPTCGCVSLGLIFPVPDFVDLGSVPSSKSFAWLSSASSAYNFATLDAPLTLRGAACTGLLLPAFSRLLMEVAMLALDFANLGTSVTARSHTRPGLLPLAIAFSQLGALPLLQGFS